MEPYVFLDLIDGRGCCFLGFINPVDHRPLTDVKTENFLEKRCYTVIRQELNRREVYHKTFYRGVIHDSIGTTPLRTGFDTFAATVRYRDVMPDLYYQWPEFRQGDYMSDVIKFGIATCQRFSTIIASL